jgi:FkbM family methyltransferase
MSRSIARMLHGVIDLLTAPQGRARKAMTLSRLAERLESANTHEISTRHGPIRALTLRGPHLAAAAVGFDDEEPELLAWIDGFNAGETLWDVGAATGLFAVYAARRGIRVVAFEPKATSFGVLVEHLALNGVGDQVFPACVAFSDRTGATHLQLHQMAAGSGGNSIDGQPNQFGDHAYMFNQGALGYRMDDFAQAFDLPAPDHLKIDVDGVEGLILRGAPRLLKSVRSVLIEVEGENAREAASRIDPPLIAAGLVEDASMRTSGSGRNRLYIRPPAAP